MTNRSDGRCQRVGGTGWIELAHEASTSGSGGVPATRAGIARMIRVPHRANDLVGCVCSLPRQLVGRVSSCASPTRATPVSPSARTPTPDPPDGRRGRGRRLYSAA
jgi:hypothetical protein